MDDGDRMLHAAGLGPHFAKSPATEAVPGFTCEICFEDEPGLLTFAMVCGHRYCTECYNHYLSQKVEEEGEAARIECPTEGCHRIVDSKTLKLLTQDTVHDR